MKLLENILVPVDFGTASDNALRYATSVAELFNSRITLLHVINDQQLSGETEALMKDFLEEKFDVLVKGISGDVASRIDYHIEKGVTFERIAAKAIETEANVIIAGAGNHEETEDRYPLGTNVEKLMRKNQVPLWVVRHDDRLPVKQILCPVDFSDSSVRALNNAILLASKFRATLEVMHVFTPINIQSARLRVDNAQENKVLKSTKEKEFEEFLSGISFGEVDYQANLMEGVPEEEILKRIRDSKADLLVMGTTGRSGLSRILMGSVTEKVTREVPVSFITTKSKEIARTVIESNLSEIETYIRKAADYRKRGDIVRAIEYYTLGLKQFPDNIPILIGLYETHAEAGNREKSAYYRNYAREIVERLWGSDYLEKFGLE